MNRLVVLVAMAILCVPSASLAQYESLIVGKWLIDSTRTEAIDSDLYALDANATMKGEVVQFQADGTYFTFADTTRAALYKVGTPETPLLLIASKPGATSGFQTEAEILQLDERKMTLRMLTPEFHIYAYYSRID